MWPAPDCDVSVEMNALMEKGFCFELCYLGETHEYQIKATFGKWQTITRDKTVEGAWQNLKHHIAPVFEVLIGKKKCLKD